MDIKVGDILIVKEHGRNSTERGVVFAFSFNTGHGFINYTSHLPGTHPLVDFKPVPSYDGMNMILVFDDEIIGVWI